MRIVPSQQALTSEERQLYSRLRWLLNQPGLLRGSLVDTRLKCGKKICRCFQNPRHRHPALLLGFSFKGKHRTVYVPVAWQAQVREWVARYGEIREVLDRLSREFLQRLQDRDRKP